MTRHDPRCVGSSRRALLASLFISFLALACLAAAASAADRIYWANDKSSNRISFANLDGSGGADLNTSGATGGEPRGPSIDVAGGKVYWTNPVADRISFANLDGSGGGNLNTAGATVDRPNAAAVYPAAGMIYWTNEDGDRISFARLDDTGGGNLSAPGATVNVPIGPAVDPGTGRIYWGNANPENKISFASLDGSGGDDLDTGSATVDNPHGVALDPVAGRIYWANVWGQKISYANLDGTGGGDLNTNGATVDYPIGVAIDPATRKIYWANEAGNKVSFANLDGSGGDDLSTPGATRNGSRSPVLLEAPIGSGAPTVAGGSTAGSVLTCSQGSWAPDLLGSNLYRVPQTFAYAWTRNGADVAGAGANTYTATAAGAYGCSVTATNPAGSALQASAAHAISAAPPAVHKTLITLELAAGRISTRLPVVVKNGDGVALSGKLSARTTRQVSISRKRYLAIKAASFTVGADAKRVVKLKLSKSLRRLLRRKGKLSLRLTATAKDPAGHTLSAIKTVSPKLKKRG